MKTRSFITDAFMYHSTLQKMRRPYFDSILEVGASDDASPVPDPADTAAGIAHQERIDEDNPAVRKGIAAACFSSACHISCLSQSMPRTLPSLASCFDRRCLTQSFSGLSTGIVTCRHRISVETLAASIRSAAPTEVSDLTPLFDQNGKEQGR